MHHPGYKCVVCAGNKNMTFQKLPNDRQFVACTSGHCEFVPEAIYELPKCEVNNKDQKFRISSNELMSHCSTQTTKTSIILFFQTIQKSPEVCTASILGPVW